MLVTLFCIIFSNDLSFSNLTLQTLLHWYCNHPILFLLAFSDCIGKFNLIKIENLIKKN
jgi:hypothetical protein